MKITKTTNPIHFEDLEPMRFEDLTFNLLYRSKNWNIINHLGRSGNDGGIDIEGSETFQLTYCLRYCS